MFYRPDGQSASYGNGEAKPGEIPGEIPKRENLTVPLF